MPKVIPLPDIDIEIPEKTNTGWEICDRRVEEGKGDKVFIYYEGRKISYKELQRLQNRHGHFYWHLARLCQRYLQLGKDHLLRVSYAI